jgi:predicted Zn-dependent protease
MMRKVVTFIMIVTLCPINLVLAQETKEEKKLREQQEKLEEKERERQEKEAKRRAKEEKKYATLKDFAEDLYASDPEFRQQVEKSYMDLQSEHALQAYQINTARYKPTRHMDLQSEHTISNVELVQKSEKIGTMEINRVLYDNPWVQDYVNRVGQQLVPEDSDKLYVFKVTYNPIPYAYTLSTGTVLISTGMISLLDNEAQLAYVLAHELAHIYKDHWKIKVMMLLAEEEYNKKIQQKRAVLAGILGGIGGIIGAAASKERREGAALGVIVGAGIGSIIGSFYYKEKIGVEWDMVHENQADDFALKTVLEKHYDPQEVPRLYANMDQVVRFDQRMQLGFLGLQGRIRERREYAERLLAGPLRPKYEELLKSGKLKGTTAEYNLVMAELKRDNGIEAVWFDMLGMAKRNLQQAVSLRTDDAIAAFYYGYLLKLVGRTKEEMDAAYTYLMLAIQLDTRKIIPEVHLQRALILMASKDPAAQAEAAQALREYIVSFQNKRVQERLRSSTLPLNLEVIYDYLNLLGDRSWKAPSIEATSFQAPAPAGSDRPRTVQQKNP